MANDLAYRELRRMPAGMQRKVRIMQSEYFVLCTVTQTDYLANPEGKPSRQRALIIACN